ncbi:unnamed protein product [Ilex paraguariensis]|uniref:Dirigent protein n=1 Tax=Ilex paraguariensis TaxID=185542 RepID=A0ABC8SY89_9AQUA
MEKITTILLLCSTIIAMPMVMGMAEGPKAVEEWFSKLGQKKEKVTRLHFFLHDTVSGKNPTAVTVAQANGTSKSPIFFGETVVMDDPLTFGPEHNSKFVGRAQGLYSSVGLENLALLMTMNLVFTDGKYNGSTLSLLGKNAALQTYREMPIVGGTGVFRLARGIATAKTVFFNATSLDAVVEYNVMVIHY